MKYALAYFFCLVFTACSANALPFQHFHFARPNIYSFSEQVKQPFLKDWTAADRDSLTSTFGELAKGCPGLIYNATKTGDIKLLRAGKIMTPPGQLISGQHAVAMRLPGEIIFSDLYFSRRRTQRLKTLTHELIHASDPGGLIAYSTEFSRYLRERKEQIPSPPFTLDEVYADRCASALITKQRQEIPNLFGQILKPLSARNLDFNRTVDASYSALFSATPEKLLELNLRAYQLYPDALYPRFLEMSGRLPINKEARIANAVICSTVLRKNSILVDEYLKMTLLVGGVISCQTKQYKTSDQLLELLLISYPTDQIAMRLKAHTEQKLKR